MSRKQDRRDDLANFLWGALEILVKSIAVLYFTLGVLVFFAGLAVITGVIR